ncbi:hypothetical protein FACS189452_03250 [Bacteroidia bacterium]|nr:hypothetical protein FACS189452_03250 [Bacteroidia bacterium]GHT80228.1 hypothetical protein FACS189467_1870 [Bacteroidia bacterium]
MEHAATLAAQVNAVPIDRPAHYQHAADLVILALPDDVVKNILPVFSGDEAIIVHTAGALSLQVFENRQIANFGVLYPLQTFSRQRRVEMSQTPIFVEANTRANKEKLLSLAKLISANVSELSSEQRLHLHLAAVFGSNFANHCWSIAADILQQNNIPASVLHPLIGETFDKALLARHPKDVQTGPAVRGDVGTMQKHIALLQNAPLRQRLYQLISESIAVTS